MIKVMDDAKKQISQKFEGRQVIMGEKVIMTSAKTVGQLSESVSMSDLAKYINGLTDMASEQGNVYVPNSWDKFGEFYIINKK